MGILNRLNTIIKAKANSLISKAEDPEKMLNQLIIDMTDQYNKAKTQVASSIVYEKKIKKELQEQEAKCEQWEKKVKVAVQRGDDEIAIQALIRKKECEKLAKKYRNQWELRKSEIDKIKASLRELSNKIEEIKDKKNLLAARMERAEAQKLIQETISSLNDNSVCYMFNNINHKADIAESKAMAQADLNEIKEKDKKIIDELEDLKKKLDT
ncbi:MAG: PspA/IM30 family protein [Tepidibacter sp.]|jgi:phage shock protein A|uniref:PspA/IM30 family protein n=1 Tax=Tepidibacter sp. TaxID=2529387 RepID=UPI0025D6ACD7|nr:PspA/IM30 family protein [Tepidibacter sp.]MCT4509599.1 PspA/IM30 family protein [Tepidibacter sp.]